MRIKNILYAFILMGNIIFAEDEIKNMESISEGTVVAEESISQECETSRVAQEIRENIITIEELYNSLEIKDKLDYSIFEKAIKGYNLIENKKGDCLTIIDFSKPSNEERFFVIDLVKRKVEYITYVSHGKNSGGIFPLKFSNTRESYQSSLGFYLTGTTYNGGNGYSLRLKGLEPGINSNALDRTIVVHGASYASKNFLDKYGFLGRSLGCPAIPSEVSREIIDKIKNGTVFFINGDDENYDKKSIFVNSRIIKEKTYSFAN